MGADFRSGSSVNYAERTNTLITAPAGIQDGDELVILFEIGATGTPPTPTPPTGFALASGFPITRTDGSFVVNTYCWIKPANGESGDYTVTHTDASSTAFMFAASGVDTANPLDPAPTSQIGTGTTSTAPGLTTTVDQSLIVYWVGRWNFPGLTPPGGSTPTLTLRNDADHSLFYVATGVLSPAGATGDKVATDLPQFLSNPWASGLIALKAAGSPVPPDTTPFFDDGDFMSQYKFKPNDPAGISLNAVTTGSGRAIPFNDCRAVNWLIIGTAGATGSVIIETSNDPNYSGAWNPLNGTGTSVAGGAGGSMVGGQAYFPPGGWVRASIPTGTPITGGTVTVFINGLSG